MYFIALMPRFDSEMRRMEDEMNKFRSELITRESGSFRKTGTRYTSSLDTILTHSP